MWVHSYDAGWQPQSPAFPLHCHSLSQPFCATSCVRCRVAVSLTMRHDHFDLFTVLPPARGENTLHTGFVNFYSWLSVKRLRFLTIFVHFCGSQRNDKKVMDKQHSDARTRRYSTHFADNLISQQEVHSFDFPIPSNAAAYTSVLCVSFHNQILFLSFFRRTISSFFIAACFPWVMTGCMERRCTSSQAGRRILWHWRNILHCTILHKHTTRTVQYRTHTYLCRSSPALLHKIPSAPLGNVVSLLHERWMLLLRQRRDSLAGFSCHSQALWSVYVSANTHTHTSSTDQDKDAMDPLH